MYVSFGTVGLSDRIAISVRSLEVLELVGEQRASVFVNSSLDRFSMCVSILEDAFPFYSTHDDPDVFARVAATVAAKVGEVDSRAVKSSGFGLDICDSIGMGDWSSEELEAARWEARLHDN